MTARMTETEFNRLKNAGAIREHSDRVFEEYNKTIPTLGSIVEKTVIAVITKEEKQCEAKLQKQCELWLSQRGYIRMMASSVSAIGGEYLKGWFYHVRNVKGESTLFPDLTIMDRTGRSVLLVELKVSNRYQPCQREMVQAGIWTECRTTEGFMEVLRDWEYQREVQEQ
jgi:hypothetical protein